jgi:hypothetical protein
MTRTYPNDEWGIVSLTDGTLLAGYIHLEHDALRHAALEVDVPGLPGGIPANIAVVDPGDLLLARCCSRAEATQFAAEHAWPDGGVLSPAIRRDPDADVGAQGAD